MLWKAGVLFTLFLFTLQASHIKGPQDHGLPGLRDVKYRHFLEVSRTISYGADTRAAQGQSQEVHRSKRSTIFTTGVKLCPHETMKAVITSHRAYYRLRVCQEAIWEAFRIFLDRVPNSEEYGAWVHTCQHENLCMDDLAQNFSSSLEHLDMVARRVAEQAESEGLEPVTPEPIRECTWTPPEILLPTTAEEVKDDMNMIPEVYDEYIIEFSVTIADPRYSELLSDPQAPQYQDITQDLTDKMRHVFEKIPGFKEVRIVGFRSEDVSVRYAAVFNGDVEISDEPGGTLEPSTLITEGLNAPKLRYIISKTLRQETSLPLDMQTLNFEAVDMGHPVAELVMNHFEGVVPVDELSMPAEDGAFTQSSIPALAVLMASTPAASTVEVQTQTFLPFIPDVLPELTSGGNEESPPVAAIEDAEEAVEDDTGLVPPVTLPGTVREQGEVAEPEMARTPQLEAEDRTTVGEQITPAVAVEEQNKDIIPLTVSSQPVVTISDIPTVVTPDLTEFTEEVGASVLVSLEGAIQGKEPDPKEEMLPGDNAAVQEDRNETNAGHGGETPASVDVAAVNLNIGKATPEAEVTNSLEEEWSSGFPLESQEHPREVTGVVSTPVMAAIGRSRELVVFFSLRVTNLMFSDDLFNKSSPEYKSLENTFLELLLPYLQTNLTGFKHLEILSFRNGSVVVNSRMRLDEPVPYNVTEAVHCVLEDFCNAAAKQLNIEIDSRSLEIEPADQADPCKFLACNEFSRCVVSSWSDEAECLCDPGYRSVDGQLCQSTCSLQPDYCLNGGLCEIIAGRGATCRCPVGKYWRYNGERCNERVPVPVDPQLIGACLVGILCLVCAIVGILIYVNKKCAWTGKTVTLVHTLAPYAVENTLRESPEFENDIGNLIHVTIQCPSSSASSCPHERVAFASVENLHLDAEIPRELPPGPPDRLVSEILDLHHYRQHRETWQSATEYSTRLPLRDSDNDCFDVTVL